MKIIISPFFALPHYVAALCATGVCVFFGSIAFVSGFDGVDDSTSARISRGGEIRIETQAQWNALSPAEKEVLRATVAVGGKIPASDAVRIYQGARRQEEAAKVRQVTTSDGRKVDVIANQIVFPEKKADPVKYDIRANDAGVVMLIDPTSGKSFPAWDEQTGQPVLAKPKMSERQQQEVKRAQFHFDEQLMRVESLNDFKENDYVTWDHAKLKFVPDTSWSLWKTRKSDIADKEIERLKASEDVLARTVQGNSSPVPSASPFASPVRQPIQ